MHFKDWLQAPRSSHEHRSSSSAQDTRYVYLSCAYQRYNPLQKIDHLHPKKWHHEPKVTGLLASSGEKSGKLDEDVEDWQVMLTERKKVQQPPVLRRAQ